MKITVNEWIVYERVTVRTNDDLVHGNGERSITTRSISKCVKKNTILIYCIISRGHGEKF